MANVPERSNEPVSETVDAEKQDLADVKEPRKEKIEEVEIKMILGNPEQKSKQPKACDDDPYIIKLFKSMINPVDQKNSDQKRAEKKK